jgi:hypothetical protein
MIEKKEKNFKINYWMLVSFLLFVALIVVFIFSGGSFKKDAKISSENATQIVSDFVKSQGVEVEILGTTENQDFYKTEIMVQGQQIPVYLTKDGKKLTTQLIDLEEAQQEKELNDKRDLGFSDDQNKEIKTFSNCLAEKGLIVYGAGWCSYTNSLVDYFGGKENMGGVLVECSDENQQPTENAEICQQEKIEGYPTIKFGGETLNIPRTFEAMAEVTGCTAPQV